MPALSSLSVPRLNLGDDVNVAACLERIQSIVSTGRTFEALNGDGLSGNSDVRPDPKTGAVPTAVMSLYRPFVCENLLFDPLGNYM
jgi:hypothetical protein